MPDQTQQPVSFDELAESIKFAAHDRRAAQLEEFREYTPEDLIDYLNAALLSTDTIMNGVGMASSLTAIDGIMTSALDRSREAIEGAIQWIESTGVSQDKNEEKDVPNTPAVATTKGRVAYGAQKSEYDF